MRLFAGLALSVALAAGTTSAQDDPLTRPIPANPTWTTPLTPVKIYGNTYFVGFQGLSIALIDTGDGLILIDGAVPQAVGEIEANIRSLGFRVEDVRYILNTEVHFDHAGGIAALARDSGATVIAAPLGAEALRAGHALASDPQASSLPPIPAPTNVRAIEDGETLTLGDVTVRTVLTPGHTPGSASWTWTSCEGGDCKTVVFASSLNAVASGQFSFLGHQDATEALRGSIAKIERLDCDILISAHPDNSGGIEKLAGRVAGVTPNPFVDPNACRAYGERATGILDERIRNERGL